MGDPFWDEFRRLKPDVDVIVLPGGPSAEAPAAESRFVASIRARRVRDDAGTALAAAWTSLLPDLAPPPSYVRQWQAVADDLVRLRIRAVLPGRPAVGAREVMAGARSRAGGPVDEVRWADSDGLRLVAGGTELLAVLTPPSLALTVLSAEIAVPADLFRELLAAPPETEPWP